ncbi:glutathione S-transferase N-terminal domain-containing protein [Kordiimonas sp. SCSIO 12610]|uniref:glutathione S-transferase N-terminal domain-containing protein n=1 Tax=Kordiimonas sp. SCSIO 12610 TaxID=2829597 RepID=UPI00210A993E|nr:glutathione S-transferase N-terminal domain-containing protein [Kordiimonas sp. SCSIO 12610]UTW55724.1 glutathione S-transferase N-terminal domain-containing protein [Kordiimonas sp. SCSIO 12610]
MRQLFELCGNDRDIRFSPFAWRALFCLAHKGLEFERTPLMFLEKDPYEASGSTALPVLKDGETWVTDSLDIAKYLEATYQDNPLFGSDVALGQAQFLNNFFNQVVVGGLFPMLAADVFDLLSDDNGAYFRKTREPNFGGATLEQMRDKRDSMVDAYRASLNPIRATLGSQNFLCGDAPAWADYAAMGGFMWAKVVSKFDPIANDDPINAWRERMLDLFDGLGRSAKTV